MHGFQIILEGSVNGGEAEVGRLVNEIATLVRGRMNLSNIRAQENPGEHNARALNLDFVNRPLTPIEVAQQRGQGFDSRVSPVDTRGMQPTPPPERELPTPQRTASEVQGEQLRRNPLMETEVERVDPARTNVQPTGVPDARNNIDPVTGRPVGARTEAENRENR